MDTRIYVMTHKAIEPISNDIYLPLHVGKKGKEDLGYPGDDTGDSISEKNNHYCELTGLYWIWKNVRCDIVGICHYRRFFVKDEHILEKDYIEKTLQSYDLIIPDSRCSEQGSMMEHYAAKHDVEDLLLCGQIIREKYPEYFQAFQTALHANLISIGNMWITRKPVFDRYCKWLFDILFEAEKRIDFSKYDDYQGRVMGFLSERLFRVWLLNQEYFAREEPVRMIETKDFSKDMNEVQLKYRYIKTTLQPLLQLYDAYQGKWESMGTLAEGIDQKDDFEGKIPVWVCWWQGEENAPELVKTCLNSIRKNIPGERAVLRLITLDNCMEYVTFTDTVIQKFNEGKITPACLSDMLRAELLYRYGGLWLDATYYVNQPIPDTFFEKGTFWTMKYTDPIWKADISEGRWSCNALRVSPGNLFARFLMEALWIYWEVNDSLIDSFWMDDVIALEYETFPEIRDEMNECPVSDQAVLELQKNLNREFNAEKYAEWTSRTIFFKLNRRQELAEHTLTQKQTYWGYLKEGLEKEHG